MPAHDNLDLIVARYLKKKSYNDVLDLFLKNAGLHIDSLTDVDRFGNKIDSLEDIVNAKRTYDILSGVSTLSVSNTPKEQHHTIHVKLKNGNTVIIPDILSKINSFSFPAPCVRHTLLPYDSSSPGIVAIEIFHTQLNKSYILASTSDRNLLLFDVLTKKLINKYKFNYTDEEIPSSDLINHSIDNNSSLLSRVAGACLCLTKIPNNPTFMLAGTMDGHLILFNPINGLVYTQKKNHSKYLSRISVTVDKISKLSKKKNFFFVATSSYDKSVCLYLLDISIHPSSLILITKLDFKSIPECIAFVNLGKDSDLALAIACRNSAFILLHKINFHSLSNHYLLTFYAKVPITENAFLTTQQPPTTNVDIINSYESAAPLTPLDMKVITISLSELDDNNNSSQLKSSLVDVLVIVTDSSPYTNLYAITLIDSLFLTGDSYDYLEKEKIVNSCLHHIILKAPQNFISSSARIALRNTNNVGTNLDRNLSGCWVNGSDGIIRGVDLKFGKEYIQLKQLPDDENSKMVPNVKSLETDFVDGKEILVTASLDGILNLWTIN